MAAGRLASLVELQAARILVAATLGLLLLCLAIRSAKLDAELTSWLHRTDRVQGELEYLGAQFGVDTSSPGPLLGNGQLILQEPRDPKQQALSVEALMVHLEALAIATQTTVYLHGRNWNLKELCIAPTVPDFGEGGLNINLVLNRAMPCAIKTPLDCFWEGSKLHGPDEPVSIRDSLPVFKWSNTNPELMMRLIQHNLPNAGFPFEDVFAWMQRLGIHSGYQHKPCLDPLDTNCPDTAPNKHLGQAPDIGAHLTGGCRGVASKQMHWHEEEIVGGVERNQTGYIKRAQALQTSIYLMSEDDMFEFYRKTSTIQDISNWSSDKAKLVLDAWQKQFKHELMRFASTSSLARQFKLYAMSTSAQLEPVDLHSLLDLGPFKVSLGALAFLTLLRFPVLAGLGRFRTCLLALVTSSYIGLTFIATLGLSSIMNLPLNMLTTHLLPPLAFCYSFRQLISISNIYSQQLGQTSSHLTLNCLKELYSIIKIEATLCLCPLFITSILPIPVTRVFAFQAICYISLATIITTILLPSLFTVFLLHNESELVTSEVFTISSQRAKRRENEKCDESILEEQLFSRIQDDLRNIQSDARMPADINFSAQLDADGIRTSFRLTTSRLPTQASRVNINCPPKDHSSKMEKPPSPPPVYRQFDPHPLPDLIENVPSRPLNIQNLLKSEETADTPLPPKTVEVEEDSIGVESSDSFLFKLYSSSVTSNKIVQTLVYLLSFGVLVALTPLSLNVKFGLQISDIVMRDGHKHESYTMQERYFPVYNTFAVTKGNFDYATNQKLLHDYYQSIRQADGVIEDSGKGRFWLVGFRDWLIELQEQFDFDQKRSLIDEDKGPLPDSSNAAKLAYRLLAQTGRPDNPINKSMVSSNRLVDVDTGIINPKAFYYYLFAWVINDPFTYATSEACFKPEHRADKWRDYKDDSSSFSRNLKIDKPQPITFAQIPFLMKLPQDGDSFETIMKLRSISQDFEKHNLPNFLTGIPFIFWDQFVNLNTILMLVVGAVLVTSFICIKFTTYNFYIAAITTLPIITTLLEFYCLMGCLSIRFNNIIAALLIGFSGLATVQTAHHITLFEAKDGNLEYRTKQTLRYRTRAVIDCFLVFIISSLTLLSSRIEFIAQYSYLLIGVSLFNCFNSLLLVPVILCRFGFESKHVEEHGQKESPESKRERLTFHQNKRKPRIIKARVHKKRRKHPIAKSEISLSTISEEPQLEGPVHDLNFSVRFISL